MLEVTAEFAQNIKLNHERIQRILPAGFLDATTLADYLVKKASYLLLIMTDYFILQIRISNGHVKKDLTNSGEAFHEGVFSDNLPPIYHFPFCSFPFWFLCIA